MTRTRIETTAAPRRTTIAVAVALILGAAAAPAAMAADDDLAALKQQLQALQQKVNDLQQQQNRQEKQVQETRQEVAAAPAAASGAAPASQSGPQLHAGPVTLTFGGFTELAGIYRNKSESADVGSSFNGVPMGNVEQSQLSEFRESARQSRLSILAQTQKMGGYQAEAWYEMDFLGAAPTANSNESNSYTPRIRNIYGRLMSDQGWYVLAGQNWSLATLEKKGMDPRDEDAPLTIDAQYVAGFTWTRNPQVRFVDKIADGLWVGLSLESPQATGIISGPSGVTTGFPGTSNLGNAGGTCSVSLSNVASSSTATPPAAASATCSVSGTQFTTDIAPDVIAKVAVDPGFGHYELFGLGRWFRSAIGSDSQTTFGGGVGAGAVLPLMPNLTFQLSGLVGKGIGRYGTSSLNDVVVKPDGELAPIASYQVLAGLVYNPIPELQTYFYAGREQQSKTLYQSATGSIYGLGNPALNNSGCYVLGGTCAGQNRKVDELTGGFWWKFYSGPLGNAQFGLQGGYIQRTLFEGVGGSPAAGMFEGMASFRIYPLQK